MDKNIKLILVFMLFAFVIRLAAGILVLEYFSEKAGLPSFMPDAETYYKNGKYISEYWKKDGRMTFSTDYKAFEYYMAFIIYIFGPGRYVFLFFNAFLAALTVFLLYLISDRLFSAKTAIIASSAYCIFPSLIFWSTQVLRVVATSFIISLMVYFVLLLKDRFKFTHIFLLVLSAIFCYIFYWLRPILYLLLSYSITLYFLVNLSRNQWIKNLVYAIFFFSILCYFSPSGAGFFSRLPLFVKDAFVSKMLNFSILKGNYIFQIDRMKKSTVRGKSSYSEDVRYKSAADVLRYLPKGLTFFLFAPFPWNARGFFQKATIPENIIWYALFMSVLYGIYIFRQRWREYLPILLFLITATVGYALVDSNIGTAYRHKAALLPFYFIFGAAGIEHFVRSLKEKKKTATGGRV